MTLRHLFMLVVVCALMSACTVATIPTIVPPTEQPTATALPTPSPEPTPTPVPTEPVPQGIYKWSLVEEIPFGFEGTPSERFFTATVDMVRADGRGGELNVFMTPSTNPACTQRFVITWEFVQDVSTVTEGENISLVLANQPDCMPTGGLLECYVNGKASMAYGGEVTVETMVSGGAYFLKQPRYVPYQEGNSQYLFVPVKNTGPIYPVNPGFETAVGSAVAGINVRDGAIEAGAMDALHGNFSFRVSAGGVFVYDVAYFYDAIAD